MKKIGSKGSGEIKLAINLPGLTFIKKREPAAAAGPTSFSAGQRQV
jgi:hypothetical protein